MNDDIRELIQNTYTQTILPVDSIGNKIDRSKVEAFRNSLAIDFYNLRANKIKEFSKKYYFDIVLPQDIFERIQGGSDVFAGNFVDIGNKGISLFNEGVKLKNVNSIGELLTLNLLNEQGIYRGIVDRIMRNESLSETEKRYIGSLLFGEIDEIKEGDKLILGIVHNDINKRMLYEFIISLSRGEIDVGICEAPNCCNMFTTGGPGSEQKYCSRACQVRAYRHRKKELVSVHG